MDNNSAQTSPMVAALIVAAGRGLRAGGNIPKQYQAVAGEPVLTRTLRLFDRHPGIATVQPVIGSEDFELFDRLIPVADGRNSPVPGGATRQASVLAGLSALEAQEEPPDFVLIHDGARPYSSHDLIDRILAELGDGKDAVIPGLPVTDTVKRVDPENEVIVATVDRMPLRRVQTPQGFRFGPLLAAHREQEGVDLTDDAAVMEASGYEVSVVMGEPGNIKITNPEDFKEAEARFGGVSRTGSGFDVHRFEPGDAVTLCGVDIPHSASLAGHSDADVGLHALTDALLGAIAAGDIGDHFPPSDPQWRGVASDRFLAHAADLVRERGGSIIHVDVTLICERPKIGPYKPAMRERIAQILEIDSAAVSVKATTTERLGFTGRGEGIAAQAVATVCA